MNPERRNHYRVLHVQPEAPAEVIKASYRTLMAKLHPDQGGSAELAARLNVAYAVLSDPEQRRRYDQTLKRPARASEVAPVFEIDAWLTHRVCPFCRSGFGNTPALGSRCLNCHSPLAPAPTLREAPGEIIGRRRNERHARAVDAQLRLASDNELRGARMRDLSFTGLSLYSAVRIPNGSAIRVTADTFDTVAVTVGCRAATPVFTVHARLLTLQLLRAGRGVLVNARA